MGQSELSPSSVSLFEQASLTLMVIVVMMACVIVALLIRDDHFPGRKGMHEGYIDYRQRGQHLQSTSIPVIKTDKLTAGVACLNGACLSSVELADMKRLIKNDKILRKVESQVNDMKDWMQREEDDLTYKIAELRIKLNRAEGSLARGDMRDFNGEHDNFRSSSTERIDEIENRMKENSDFARNIESRLE